MSIPRTGTGGLLTDDDGTGTTGSILNNAERQALLDLIESRWTRQTITLTGTQNNLSITASSLEADLILMNNATDTTITGIVAPASPARPGKVLAIRSIGAGNVYLSHQSASSTAANRLINFATSSTTPIAAGVGYAVYQYDDNASRWVLRSHHQGAWIAFVPAGTAATGSWTIDNPGDVSAARYWLKDRTLQINFAVSTTTTSNATATVSLTIPNSYTTSFSWVQANVRAVETATEIRAMQLRNGTTSVAFQRLDGSNWSALTNNLTIQAFINIEVD